MTLSPARAAAMACSLELLAPCPGTVSPAGEYAFSGAADFLLATAAWTPLLDRAAAFGIGPTIRAATRAMRQATQVNPHLGVILLLVSLAVADSQPALHHVLESLTRADAADVFAAIRLANPGGLGRAEAEDVRLPPSMPLRPIMALAAERDLVARQYANGFTEVFDLGLPWIAQGCAAERPLEEIIVGLALQFQAHLGDSLICRVHGSAVATEAQERARALLAAGWPEDPESPQRLAAFDAWLRADAIPKNPGAVADLVVASLFLALRKSILQLPLTSPFRSSRLRDHS